MGRRRAQLDCDEEVRQFIRWARHTRQLLGLSQDKLARSCGISQGAISRLESGRDVHLRTVIPVYRALHAEAKALVGYRPPSIAGIFAAEQPKLLTNDTRLEVFMRAWNCSSPRQRELFWECVRPVLNLLSERHAALQCEGDQCNTGVV